MNTCIFMGRLTRDPEIRTSAAGNTVARFSLAIDRPGTREERVTDFPSFLAFSKTADFIEKYITKGMRVLVTSHCQTGSYEKEDGSTVYTTDFIVDRIEFADSKKTAEDEALPFD